MKAGSREAELKKEGWIKCFTIDEPRLSEAVELYESLGFDVRLEPATTAEGECAICYDNEPTRFKTIYTRPKRSGHPKP